MKKLILIHSDSQEFFMEFCIKFHRHIREPAVCTLMLLAGVSHSNEEMAKALHTASNNICEHVQGDGIERVFITNDKAATDAVVELHEHFNVFNIYIAPQYTVERTNEPSFTVINDLDDIDYAFMRCVSWVFDV